MTVGWPLGHGENDLFFSDEVDDKPWLLLPSPQKNQFVSRKHCWSTPCFGFKASFLLFSPRIIVCASHRYDERRNAKRSCVFFDLTFVSLMTFLLSLSRLLQTAIPCQLLASIFFFVFLTSDTAFPPFCLSLSFACVCVCVCIYAYASIYSGRFAMLR